MIRLRHNDAKTLAETLGQVPKAEEQRRPGRRTRTAAADRATS
ncbi:hypothetical protein P4054_29440 [Pseudomonas aeruginosa]|nr:hypothetical protein [Pseudomonas aeruginosa]